MGDMIDNDDYPSDVPSYAEWSGQPWTEAEAETLGLRPVTDGGVLYCACATRLAFAINGVRYQWPKDSVLRWHIGISKLGDLSQLDLIEARKRTCAEIEGYVKRLKFEYTTNHKTANLIASTRSIDGQSLILAEHEVPMGKVNSGTQLRGWFDTSEGWTLTSVALPGKIDWERTDKHELLHGLGFGHGKTDKSNPALLEAMYSWSISMLQPRDIEELQIRYEKAVAAPAQPAPQLPGSKSVHFKDVKEISQDGKVWRGTIEGELIRVQ